MSASTSWDLDDVLNALSGERWPITQARGRVRAVPGLYAIYGNTDAWAGLGLDPQPGSALYVGKAEDSLAARELDTHFAADPAKKPRTGSSTVRRSFAALLRDTLNLHAVPRNPDKPGHFTNYGLNPDGDARLTTWMHQHLFLAVWERHTGLTQPLAEIEGEVIKTWMPPLNIQGNPRPLPRLRQARQVMALEAAGSPVPAAPEPATPATLHASVDRVAAPTRRSGGLTPVELARELGKSPKTVRQALRDKYGRLPFDGDRWGGLSPAQEDYLRARFR